MSETNNPTAQSSEDATTFVVPPPFDKSPHANCILKSHDGVEFRVTKEILSFASPDLAVLFGGPQGGKDEKLPVFDFQEDADTVLQLLILLSPTGITENLKVGTAIKLAKVYKTYRIPNGRLLQALKCLYNSRDTLKENSLELLVLAHGLGLEPEASKASRFTHGIPTMKLVEVLPRELLEKLLDLRKRREEQLDLLIAAIEPTQHICKGHKEKGSEFFSEIVALKKKVRLSLQAPYPEELGAFAFFGQAAGYSPRQFALPSNERNSKCKCFTDVTWTSVAQDLKKALGDFPQHI